jgi:hypothetical protein
MHFLQHSLLDILVEQLSIVYISVSSDSDINLVIIMNIINVTNLLSKWLPPVAVVMYL